MGITLAPQVEEGWETLTWSPRWIKSWENKDFQAKKNLNSSWKMLTDVITVNINVYW